jgi:CRISPR-associated exonuclease Cas4
MATMLNWAFLGLVLWALWWFWANYGRGIFARQEHNRWLPPEQQGATIAFAEKEFIARSPFPVGAIVDRAYRLSSGLLVLMELKQRERVKSFFSDVVELSVQKLAIEASGGGTVAPYAYVVCESPATHRKTPLRIELLTEGAIVQLRNRHVALKTGRVVPTKVDHPALCEACEYRAECKPASLKLARSPQFKRMAR